MMCDGAHRRWWIGSVLRRQQEHPHHESAKESRMVKRRKIAQDQPVLSEVLDHVLVVGASVRRNAWRVQEDERRHRRIGDNQSSGDSDGGSLSSASTGGSSSDAADDLDASANTESGGSDSAHDRQRQNSYRNNQSHEDSRESTNSFGSAEIDTSLADGANGRKRRRRYVTATDPTDADDTAQDAKSHIEDSIIFCDRYSSWPSQNDATSKNDDDDDDDDHDPRSQSARGRDRGMRDINRRFDRLHGDSINPVAFSMAKCSQNTSIPEEKRHLVDGVNLRCDSDAGAIPPDQTMRALLLRCWDRAVHASSNAMYVKIPNNGESKTNNTVSTRASASSTKRNARKARGNKRDRSISDGDDSGDDSGDGHVIEGGPCHNRDTERICQKLEIELAKDNEALACPTCSATFPTVARLQEHFYGRSSILGCCWTKVKARQQLLVGQYLERVAQNHVDVILRQLAQTTSATAAAAASSSSAPKLEDASLDCHNQAAPANESNRKDDNSDQRTQQQPNRKMKDWEDVLNIMEAFAEEDGEKKATRDRTTCDHPIQKRIAVDGREIVFNRTVWEAVRERAVLRYTDVPY